MRWKYPLRQINGIKPWASLSSAPNIWSSPMVTLHQHCFGVLDWLVPNVYNFCVLNSLLAFLILNPIKVSWINWQWFNSEFWVTWLNGRQTHPEPISNPHWCGIEPTLAHFSISLVTGLSVHSSLEWRKYFNGDVKRIIRWFRTWAGRHSFSKCRCGSHTQNGLSSCSPRKLIIISLLKAAMITHCH